MASKTVSLTSYLFNGTTGLTLLLLNPETGAIGNGSGDALTAGSNGLFTAVVTEAITGWWKVVVLQGAVPILEGGWVYFAADAEGTYVVDDPDAAAPSGSGPRSVSITVLLSGSPVQGAKVRLTKAAESYLAETNGSGVAAFNVNDGTWSVAITSPGAYFTGASLVVDGTEAVSYSMTANAAITASDPGRVTGYWLCLSHLGVAESGVTVSLNAVSLASGSTGLAIDTATRTATSGADGIVSFANLVPGVRYKVIRGSGSAQYFVCPDASDEPLDLASIIGT